MNKNYNYDSISAFIANTNSLLDYTKYLTPINLREENERFIQAHAIGIEYNPIYRYEEYVNIDFDELKKEFFLYYNTLGESALDNIFKRLLLEGIHSLDFYRYRGNSDQFSKYSKLAFDIPSESLINYSQKILLEYKNNPYKADVTSMIYSGENLAECIINELKKYGYNWEVLVLKNLSTKVTVDPELRKVYINGSKKYSEIDLKRLIVHEVGTHIVRSENGRKQPYPFFASGLAGSLSTEEGLAVYSEYKSNLLEKDTFAMYAGRVIASSLCLTKSFFEIYSYLCNFLPNDVSLYITQRVKKGLIDTSEAGGFTKDYVYLDGFVKIRKFIENGGDYEILYLGSVGLDDIPDLLKLVNNGILSKDIVIPNFMGEKND